MKEVHIPRSLNQVWDLLDREPGAMLYAGGTDLIPKVRKGLLSPPSLICLERVRALKEVTDGGEEVFLGAGLTHHRVEALPSVQREFPLLAQAVGVLASPPIRHMGTMGGNIVTASPAGDTLPALTVLRAEVELVARERTRRMALADFIKGPGRTALEPGEILRGLWIRKASHFSVHHYEKVGRRKAQAIAVVSMAALLLMEGDIVKEARFAWGSAGPTVMTSRAVEEVFTGNPLSLEVLKRAALLAESAVKPIDDIRASAAYRREVAGRLLFRLLPGEIPSAGGEPGSLPLRGEPCPFLTDGASGLS
ncbi:MAG: xanthine dehydrogenase family protein subunit M [Candidatus Eremiobacteraeota bacterium]|nr:xanthine dehydrogenase family protein subunit M [Candidatus Eremiobacteraeota bacterium]